MSEPKLSDFTTTSGRNIGRNAKKMFGCEECNFMMLQSVAKEKAEKDIRFPSKLKTGSDCPRCGAPTVRLFDSTAEHTRACELKLQRDRGEIEELEFQPRFALLVQPYTGFEYDDDWSALPIKLGDMIADFAYYKKNDKDDLLDYVVEDVKNKSLVTTDISKWKIRHFEAQYQMPLRIVAR